MGEPGRGLPGMQPPQGEQDPGRGAHAPASRATRAARRRALPVRDLPDRRSERRLADLPLPRRFARPPLIGPMRDGDPFRISLPDRVRSVLASLVDAGAEAALVGGSVRDLLRRDPPADWDVATSAPPEQVAELFPGSTWQNPFGTVTVRDTEGEPG